MGQLVMQITNGKLIILNGYYYKKISNHNNGYERNSAAPKVFRRILLAGA